MAIFSHRDCDGDAVEILADDDDPQEDLALLTSSRTGHRAAGVRIDRDAALRLHTALGEWLYPVHTPEGPNRSLIEQMIERAVKDQVAAVLPLHLKTVGEYVANYGRGPEAIRPQHSNPEPRDGAWPVLATTCHHNGHHGVETLCSECVVIKDPEPRDVGHPEDCGLCGRDQDPNGHDCVPPKYEDARPHPADEFLRGIRRMAHSITRAAVPECGKCGAPWSDTHGQPGDPCAPAPSAPAPAGPTWDDELWSAPSAEASARTLPVPACPECGHSWRAHSPHSTAPYCIQRTGGTRDCECTRVRP